MKPTTPTTPATSGPTTQPEPSVPSIPPTSASGVLGVTADEAARLKEPVNPGDAKAEQRDPEIPSAPLAKPQIPEPTAVSVLEACNESNQRTGSIRDVIRVLATAILDIYKQTGHAPPAELSAVFDAIKG